MPAKRKHSKKAPPVTEARNLPVANPPAPIVAPPDVERPPPTQLIEIDRLRAWGLNEHNKYLRALQQVKHLEMQLLQTDAQLGELELEQHKADLDKRYRLGPNDDMNLQTGLITRKG